MRNVVGAIIVVVVRIVVVFVSNFRRGGERRVDGVLGSVVVVVPYCFAMWVYRLPHSFRILMLVIMVTGDRMHFAFVCVLHP